MSDNTGSKDQRYDEESLGSEPPSEVVGNQDSFPEQLKESGEDIDEADIARFKEEIEEQANKNNKNEEKADDSKDKPQQNAQDNKESASRWNPKKRSLLVSIIIVLLILLGMCLILYAWRLPPFDLATKQTNNAYLRGQPTMISPKVNGYISEILVQDFDQVYQNQPILKIEDTQYAAAVENARAQLDSSKASLSNNEQQQKQAQAQADVAKADILKSQAELKRLQVDFERVSALVQDGSVSRRERDQVKAMLESARASNAQAKARYSAALQQVKSAEIQKDSLKAAVDSAQAGLHSAEYDLSNTVIRAPRQGLLGQMGARVGQFVNAGSQLTFLVPPVRWVIANYKEKDVEHMRLGQSAYVTVDSLGKQKFYGIVTDIAPATASEFSAIKPDPGVGNFVKIAQRIPVKIQLFTDQPGFYRLSPGMSVEAYVDTSSEPITGHKHNANTRRANENIHHDHRENP